MEGTVWGGVRLVIDLTLALFALRVYDLHFTNISHSQSSHECPSRHVNKKNK
ncbi:hypothetical protein HYC85_001377 [Camellia sinensis]|uniref:Uncharacterized protein n=1 Tax=Camellia sinensis TaxID=4442 RepID=A0A7J7I7Q5_CAMSI|nr:hypothetical protein HYC85_001377 [Camellia sinensis]